ncbi:MAG: hypothetical protein IKV55_03210 [Oscillospiraceae bacterium]|nr:hypothetical protein [Oscillospiraceae bacterium]
MKNSSISFYGYNDGRAIRIYNCIGLFRPTVISVAVSLAISVPEAVLRRYALLVVWTFPAVMLLVYLLVFACERADEKVFLAGTKKKHAFVVQDGLLLRDGKPLKKERVKVYAFRNFVFLITQKSYYRVPNEAFAGMSREAFLRFMQNEE